MKRIDKNGIVTETFKRAVQSALKKKGLTYKEFCSMAHPPINQHGFSIWITGHMKNTKRQDEYFSAISDILGL